MIVNIYESKGLLAPLGAYKTPW